MKRFAIFNVMFFKGASRKNFHRVHRTLARESRFSEPSSKPRRAGATSHSSFPR
jgi:hypothetical protein